MANSKTLPAVVIGAVLLLGGAALLWGTTRDADPGADVLIEAPGEVAAQPREPAEPAAHGSAGRTSAASLAKDAAGAVSAQADEERRVRREAGRREAALQRRDQLDELAIAVSLTSEQVEELAEFIAVEHSGGLEAFDAARATGNYSLARQEARGLREATERHAAEIMNEEQLAGWAQMRERGRALKIGGR